MATNDQVCLGEHLCLCERMSTSPEEVEMVLYVFRSVNNMLLFSASVLTFLTNSIPGLFLLDCLCWIVCKFAPFICHRL